MRKITPEMVREALAHIPNDLVLDPERPAYTRWEWLANFLNDAMKNPGRVCPCCGVTAAGDLAADPETQH